MERIDISPSGFRRFHKGFALPHVNRSPPSSAISRSPPRRAGRPFAVWIGVYLGESLEKAHRELVGRIALVVDPISDGIEELRELRLD
jgi:hypothetical protein